MKYLADPVRLISAAALFALLSGCHMHVRDRDAQGNIQIVQNGQNIDIVARSENGQQNGGLSIHTSDGGPARIQGMIHVDGQADFHLDGVLGQNRVQKEVQQRFASDRVDRLQVTADSGSIEVKSTDSDRDEIQVRAVKTLSGSQRELRSLMDKVVVTAALQGRTLVVRSEIASGALPSGVSSSVDYIITVPKRLAAQLTSGSGDISVEAIQGGLVVQTGNGDVTLKAVGGTLQVQAASGGVHLEGGRISDTLDISAASGDLELSGVSAAGPALAVKLSTASGSIHYEGDASRLDVNSSSGDIELKPTSHLPLGPSDIASASGGITMTLPTASSAHITAHTESGSLDLPRSAGASGSASSDDASSDNSSEDEDRHDATVQIGSGAAAVQLKTASGDISVHTD